MPYLSALEVGSPQGAIQIHIYLYLYSLNKQKVKPSFNWNIVVNTEKGYGAKRFKWRISEKKTGFYRAAWNADAV